MEGVLVRNESINSIYDNPQMNMNLLGRWGEGRCVDLKSRVVPGPA